MAALAEDMTGDPPETSPKGINERESPSRRPVILAVDVGTSAVKCALVSVVGQVIASASEGTHLDLLPDGGAEQDPDEWWHAIGRATGRLLDGGQVSRDDVVAVSCTGQWSGTVAVDRAGDHLMNAIISMDSRGAPYIRQVTSGPIRVRGYGISKLLRWLRLTGGIPCHSGRDPIAHILYIKNESPDIYEDTYKFLEPKDYINLRLTGRCAASVDSVALHWVTDNRDIFNIAYDDRLVKMSTIDREKLPELKRATDILGPIKKEVAEELGLSERVKVVMGTPDVQSAAIGAGAVEDYVAHLYLGTSSWLTCHVPFKRTDLFHNIASLPSAVPGRYFVANEQETAGACLTFLRENILSDAGMSLTGAELSDVYETLEQIVQGVRPGSGKVIFTPWLYGEHTPVENPCLRAAFFNQSLKTTRRHLVRAVYEGVSYNSRWLLTYVERFVRRRLDPIRIVGGGANSSAWCQIYADVLGRTIQKVEDPILATARGAAFLASVALGYLTFHDIAEQTKIAGTFEPNPHNKRIYDELFDQFVRIYESNARIYEALNKPQGSVL